MSAPIAISTEGGRRVAELVAQCGPAEFGRRVQTSPAMARHMATGRKTPGADLRARIRDAFGVDVESWSRAAPPQPSADDVTALGRKVLAESAAPPPAPAPAPAARPLGGIEGLRATIARVDTALEALEADKLVPHSARAALLRIKVDAHDRLAKLQGEGELTWPAIRRSAVFQAFAARLEQAMAKHPAAAEEVARLFEQIEASA